MIHLSFNGAKLQESHSEGWKDLCKHQTLGFTLQSQRTSHSVLLYHVSRRHRKAAFSSLQGNTELIQLSMLVWSTHMQNHAAPMLLHCAKQRKNVQIQLLVLDYLSKKGPVGVWVWVGENWTCLSHPHRTSVYPSDEPASRSPAGSREDCTVSDSNPHSKHLLGPLLLGICRMSPCNSVWRGGLRKGHGTKLHLLLVREYHAPSRELTALPNCPIYLGRSTYDS